MIYVLFWAVLAVCVGYLASKRGRSGFGWFLFSCILTPVVGVIMVALLPDLSKEDQLTGRVPCPACKEPVLPDALKCKHCGSTLTPSIATHSSPPPEPARKPSRGAYALGRHLGRGAHIYLPAAAALIAAVAFLATR